VSELESFRYIRFSTIPFVRRSFTRNFTNTTSKLRLINQIRHISEHLNLNFREKILKTHGDIDDFVKRSILRFRKISPLEIDFKRTFFEMKHEKVN